MAKKLSKKEKSALEKITSSADEFLTKRATIILLSNGGNLTAADIAREVGFAPRTVRHWQREFGKKRLAIFPAHALNGDQSSPEEAIAISTETQLTAAPSLSPTAAEPLQIIEMIDEESSTQKTAQPNRQGVIEYPVRKTIGLKPTDTLAEAGRKVLGFHFARMLQHEPGTRVGHSIEALHDMRVAIRRMRAAFPVFEVGFSKKAIKPLIVGLKATGRALGRVRDLDVFMQKFQDYQQSLPADEQSVLQPLLDTWHTEREQARQEMLAYLDSKKYLKFRQDFLKFVTTEGLGVKPIPKGVPVPYQLRHLTPGLIYERYEAVYAYEIVLDNAALDTLHQLRITLKQLRYALEYFEEILGKERKMVIEEVKTLQDHLGDLNDAHVASELLRDFLVNWDQNQLHLPLAERQSPTYLVAYLNAKLEERQRLIVDFPAAWAHFNRPEFRRNLALTLAVL